MLGSIQRFTQEPLEEWVLDYPQQISISVIHLILSQEITDILSSNEPDSSNYNVTQVSTKQSPAPDAVENTVAVLELTNGSQIKQYEEIAMKVGGSTTQTELVQRADGQPLKNEKGRRVKVDTKDVK